MAEQAGEAGGKPRHFGRGTSGRLGEARAPAEARRAPGTVQDALDRMAAGIGERRRAREERDRNAGDRPESDAA